MGLFCGIALRVTCVVLCLLFSTFLVGKELRSEQLEKISCIVSQYKDLFCLPGIGIGIVYKNASYMIHDGVQDLEQQTPVTEDTLFRIGSLTKGMLALVILELASKQSLHLDDPIKELGIPLHIKDPSVEHQLTVRDLLCHRSGLSSNNLFLLANKEKSKGEFIRQLGKLEFTNFRSEFKYTSLNCILTAHVIESLTKKSWEDNLENIVLSPLYMHHTTPRLHKAKASDHLSSSYIHTGHQFVKIPELGLSEPEDSCGNLILSMGGVFSTTQDMTLYVKFLLENWNLGLKELFTTQIPVSDSGGYFTNVGHGLGWYIAKHNDVLCFHHPGDIDGFSSHICLFPDQEFGIVILANAHAHYSMHTALAKYIFDHVFYATEDPNYFQRMLGRRLFYQQGRVNKLIMLKNIHTNIPACDSEEYLGSYFNDIYGTLNLFTQEQDIIGAWNSYACSLLRYAPDLFYCTLGSIYSPCPLKCVFLRNTYGEIYALNMQADSCGVNILFKKEVHQPSIEDYLGEFQGMVPLQVIVKNDKLFLVMGSQFSFELCAESPHRFFLKNDPHSKITYIFSPEGNSTTLQWSSDAIFWEFVKVNE